MGAAAVEPAAVQVVAVAAEVPVAAQAADAAAVEPAAVQVVAVAAEVPVAAQAADVAAVEPVPEAAGSAAASRIHPEDQAQFPEDTKVSGAVV